MKSVNCILLVDDDESDNFFHTLTIKEAGICDQIKVATDGRYALDYMINSLKDGDNGEFPKPDIIFLDINMPRLDGFDFLDEYMLLEETKTSGIVIIMLTTSMNPYDIEKAMKYKVVKDYRNKPLTTDMLEEITGKFL